jgi:hypothetical protein
MNDETVDLSRALVGIGNTILESSADTRERIAQAYQEARLQVATIALDNGDARPKIIARFGQSDRHQEANDIAFVGWILLAIAIRVNEQNLRDWEKLSDVVRQLVGLLQVLALTVH